MDRRSSSRREPPDQFLKPTTVMCRADFPAGARARWLDDVRGMGSPRSKLGRGFTPLRFNSRSRDCRRLSGALRRARHSLSILMTPPEARELYGRNSRGFVRPDRHRLAGRPVAQRSGCPARLRDRPLIATWHRFELEKDRGCVSEECHESITHHRCRLAGFRGYVVAEPGGIQFPATAGPNYRERGAGWRGGRCGPWWRNSANGSANLLPSIAAAAPAISSPKAFIIPSPMATRCWHLGRNGFGQRFSLQGAIANPGFEPVSVPRRSASLVGRIFRQHSGTS